MLRTSLEVGWLHLTVDWFLPTDKCSTVGGFQTNSSWHWPFNVAHVPRRKLASPPEPLNVRRASLLYVWTRSSSITSASPLWMLASSDVCSSTYDLLKKHLYYLNVKFKLFSISGEGNTNFYRRVKGIEHRLNVLKKQHVKYDRSDRCLMGLQNAVFGNMAAQQGNLRGREPQVVGIKVSF